MFKLEKNKLYNYILYTFFSILFVLEPFVKIFDTAANFRVNLRIKAVIKLLLLAGIIVFIIFKKAKKEVLVFLLILLLSFFLGQLILTNTHSIFGNDVLQEFKTGDVYRVVKYLYILFFVAFYEKIEDNIKLTAQLVKLFNGFIIVNTIFIIIGLITQLDFLKTYPFTPRFGYQGLMELAGESIHLYTIAISLAYIKYVKTKRYGLLLFFIIGGILIGKKAIFLYLFTLILVHLIYYKKYIHIYGIAFLSILFLVFNKFIIKTLLILFPFWQKLYESDGLVTVIFSLRDILFYKSIDYIQVNWHPLNYIFGGSDLPDFRTEFGFFDFFLTFGLLGVAIYFCFIYKYFFAKNSVLVKGVFFAILITEAVSGGLIINIIPMIFLYLIAKYFEKKENSNVLTV